MKKLFIITVIIALAMGGVAQEAHFDFSVTNSTGYNMYYRIVDAQNHWVEITYPCQNGDNYWWGYDKPEGKIILSDTIAYQGTDYYLVAIGNHAFCGCSGLRGTLEFPETIQSIGAGAFKGCSNLNGNLNIPSLVTRIEDETFYGCSGFSGKLYLTDSLTYIGSKAFQQCVFKGLLMLPSTLTFIGDEAFKGCTSFSSISIKAVTPPTTGSNAFDEIPTWMTVAVPYTAKDAYRNTSGWLRFANHIVEKSYWNGKAEPWTKGSGTTEDPYLIESAENLAWLAKSVNEKQDVVISTGYSQGGGTYFIYHYYDVMAYQDTCFRLVIDVDLRKGEMYWDPIGNSQYVYASQYQESIFTPHYSLNVFNIKAYYYISYFSGQFDGNNHVISNANYLSSFNLVGNGAGTNYKYKVGLFGIVDHADIRNLTINSFTTNVPYGYPSGGLAGQIINSNIYNCHTSGEIKQSNPCGGIVGVANRSRIEQCSAQIDFSASRVGGISGVFVCDSVYNPQNGVFNCSFIGNMNDPVVAGGVISLCQSLSEGTGTIHIENCFSRGTMIRICPDPDHYVESGRYIFGGIVGDVANIDTLYIRNCYSNDSIYTVSSNIGNHWHYGSGILAYADANTTISIKNCYHVGPIITQYKGGILAQNTNMTIVRNSFFDRTVAPDDGFGLPLESDYMKTEAFVSHLNNGSTVFRIDTEPYENDGYPIFGTDGLVFVGAEWYYEIHNDDGSITYQHLQCSGDTVVQGKRPKIIIRSNTQYDRNESEVTHEYVYEENGKVYWWNNTLGKFTVLYDFSADVGDEWTVEVGNESFTTHVYEANLQYIDGIPYKKLTIADHDNLFSGSLLSTVGHTTSFFPEKLMSRGKGYRVEGLRCYWLDGDLKLKFGDKDCDEVYQQYHNGIKEDGTSTDSGALVVYPNPVDGVLFVETQNFASLPDPTYRITNPMGQTMMTGVLAVRLPNPPAPFERGNCDSPTTIDVSNLPAGMYFISVGEITMKFVKQ